MFLEPPTYYNHAFLAEENLHALHTLHDDKVCVLDLVQLEDDLEVILYF